MARLFVIVPFLVLALDVFSVVDVITIDHARVRALPKAAWVALIIVLPVVGALLWFFVGRQRLTGAEMRQSAPDDDPAFLKNLRRDEDQDERIRRLEQEIADLDDDPHKD